MNSLLTYSVLLAFSSFPPSLWESGIVFTRR
jgi:hypothetical protein